ncbi:GNAT family N-acetyltransferase [Streptomyces colonosanans]|uniref:GNAT family N-acetyltransferase n=1 Tax=Streptomyces colonosanans TaxID=1428652 RepID=A0A1S2PLA1_9ACTN|nr:GNAT family N-acetyltransferase [Streptomyces colonosanans]OIJ94567.1 GNAT family N-acetyltransferase [Streptomyces colonosanans]
MSIRITPLIDPEHGPSSRRLAWLASDTSGVPVGSAFLRLFTKSGQDHLAELELHVHPAERRNGTGTRLLNAAVNAAREDGRRSLVAQAELGSPGAQFLSARGFCKVLTLIYSRLHLANTNVAALTQIIEQSHPGYQLLSWDGTVPDSLAESFALSRRAMDDMPMGDTDYGTVIWDVDRVRAAAAAVAQRGDLLHTVAAIDEADGSIAGFTELVVPGDGKGDGQHYGTGVLPEHRGHGLGRWMKATAIRQACERHPDLGGLLTDTADTNLHMRAINDELGYAPTHQTIEYQLALASR